MSRAERTIAPFPPIPPRLADAYDAYDLRLRRFGCSGDDLAVDFESAAVPHLITEILVCCTKRTDGQSPDRQFFWELDISKRIQCLLILASLEGAGGIISVALRCPNLSCGQPIEIDLTIEELLEAEKGAWEDEFSVSLGEKCLVLRRPTAADQLSWLQQSFVDEDCAVRMIIRTLLVEGPQIELTQEWISRIEEALDRHDPLLQFGLSVICPYCQKLAEQNLDLAEFAMRKLKEAQARLIEAVHRLATHYHWSEAEILRLPPWRRARYLSLVEREEVR